MQLCISRVLGFDSRRLHFVQQAATLWYKQSLRPVCFYRQGLGGIPCPLPCGLIDPTDGDAVRRTYRQRVVNTCSDEVATGLIAPVAHALWIVPDVLARGVPDEASLDHPIQIPVAASPPDVVRPITGEATDGDRPGNGIGNRLRHAVIKAQAWHVRRNDVRWIAAIDPDAIAAESGAHSAVAIGHHPVWGDTAGARDDMLARDPLCRRHAFGN